jgi:hypothetical protein
MRDDLDDDLDDLSDEEEPETPAAGSGDELPEDFRSSDQPPAKQVIAPNVARKPRPTRAEMQVRVATVATMLINGFKRHDVHAYVNEKLAEKWDFLSERGIDRLIQRATKVIGTEATADIVLEKGKANSRLDYLYRKAVDAKLYGTALRVQRAINKMHGLEAPIKLRHGSDPENPLPAGGGNFYVLIQEVAEG